MNYHKERNMQKYLRSSKSGGRILILFSLLLFVAGCSNNFQPESFFSASGYRDSQISENVFFVSYVGRSALGPNDPEIKKIRDLALLRASDITIENGYSFFSIKPSDLTPKELRRDPDQVTTADFDLGIKFRASRVIIASHEPQDEVTIYDAHVTKRSVRERYGLAE